MNATGLVNRPSMINGPPTTSIQPAVRSSGDNAMPAGMPPNQPKIFIVPGQKSRNPDTIRSDACVARASEFVIAHLRGKGGDVAAPPDTLPQIILAARPRRVRL